MTAAEYFATVAARAFGCEPVNAPFPYIGMLKLPRGGFARFTVDLGYRAVWSFDYCRWEDIPALSALHALIELVPRDCDAPEPRPGERAWLGRPEGFGSGEVGDTSGT